jgi:hypothetical protein
MVVTVDSMKAGVVLPVMAMVYLAFIVQEE